MPKGLDIMLAVGKKPVAEEESPEEAMMQEEEGMMPDEVVGESQSVIALPKGFRLPEGAKEGSPFTTTIRGVARNGQFEVQALGDMPMHSEAMETPEEEASESEKEQANEPSPEGHSAIFAAESEKYKKKKNDEMSAQKAFRG